MDLAVPDLPISETTSREASETIEEAQTNSPTDQTEPIDTKCGRLHLTDFGIGTLVPRGMDRRAFG